MAIVAAFGLMGAFFMAGLYVAGALGVLSLLLMSVFGGQQLWNVLPSRSWQTYTEWNWVAIPLFILMGELVLRSGIAEKMYSSLSRWVALLPGGLLHTNIASSALFAASAGSSIATAATISRVALPAFKTRGYNERMVLGSLAAGGTLGILIPPSIILLIYALSTGQSIPRMFLAGFVPGFMIAGIFMLMIGVSSIIWPGIAPREFGGGLWDKAAWKDRIMALLPMLPMITLITLVLGTIYTDVFVPSEAAAAGVAGAFILAVVHTSGALLRRFMLEFLEMSRLILILPRNAKRWIRATLGGHKQNPNQIHEMLPNRQLFPIRQLFIEAATTNFTMLGQAFLSTIRTTSMIMLILMAAFTLQFAFARLGMSQEIAGWVTGFNLSPIQLVLVLVVFYLLLGTFMESYSMLFVTLPIVLPALRAAGVDLFWFGIILVILFELAQITPPQGMALYVLHAARREVNAATPSPGDPETKPGITTGTIGDVYIGVLPFIACMILVLALLIAFPGIVSWFPDLVKGQK